MEFTCALVRLNKCRRRDISVISRVTLKRRRAAPQKETLCVLIARQESQPGYTDWLEEQQVFSSSCSKTGMCHSYGQEKLWWAATQIRWSVRLYKTLFGNRTQKLLTSKTTTYYVLMNRKKSAQSYCKVKMPTLYHQNNYLDFFKIHAVYYILKLLCPKYLSIILKISLKLKSGWSMLSCNGNFCHLGTVASATWEDEENTERQETHSANWAWQVFLGIWL